MSDFEFTREKPNVYLHFKGEAEALRAENAALREMLAKHQWGNGSICPECNGICPGDGYQVREGHNSNCALAALLGGPP